MLIVPLLKNIVMKFSTDSSAFYQDYHLTKGRLQKLENLFDQVVAENHEEGEPPLEKPASKDG